ncbi:MAG: aminoacyl-tRNA deacylase [Phycisphaerae bacterium]
MNLELELQQRKIPYQKHEHRTTFTSQGLAQVEHVSGYHVAKPVVVKGPTGFAMCVLPAPYRVDLERVAAILGESVVRLANETELSRLFPGCELGAEPPLGHLFGMRTIMDESLRHEDFIIMQAGLHTESVRIARQDYEAICRPLVANIARRTEALLEE